MFIFYTPDTLEVHHIVEQHPPNYGEYLSALPNPGTYIEHSGVIPFAELYLTKDAAGVVTSNRRAPAPAIRPPTSLTVNVEATFAGVPEGTLVFINDSSYGAMDASGVLQFTPGVAGFYKFRFEKAGVMPKEFNIEAVS